MVNKLISTSAVSYLARNWLQSKESNYSVVKS